MKIIAMVWSCLFLALILITAISVLINSLRIQRLITKNLLLINSSSKLSFREDESPDEILDLKLPKIMPFMFISYKLIAENGSQRRLVLVNDLQEGENSFKTEALKADRGVYHSTPGAVEIISWFRFFISRIEFRGDKEVTVIPSLEKPASLIDYRENGGEISSSNKSIRKEDDLVDSRKYYPGDDPRKINWKHYARSDDLYIRQGEEGIPYQKKVLIIFDIENCADDWGKCDKLCRRLAVLVDNLCEEEIEIEYLLPGKIKPKKYDKKEFHHALATITPGTCSSYIPREKGEIWICAISSNVINSAKWKPYINRVKFLVPTLPETDIKRGVNVFEI